MKHSVAHSLGIELARKVARSAFDAYVTRFSEYAPTASWQGEDKAQIGFNVKGVSLKGQVEVKSSSFEIDMDVPFLLKPFQGKAIGIIEGEIKTWIEKAKSGALS